jgi:SAM-dependent methyltransferase
MSAGLLEPAAVRTMFDRIAPVYDAMNRAMTMGLDRRWRRLAAHAVVTPGDRVLDACCGTGDMALAAHAVGGEVVGVDFSEPMLERARRKAPDLEWVCGDATELPFADGSFDAVTVGFGVRNLQDLEAGDPPGRAARLPGDHEAAGAAEAVLPAVVRRPGSARRQGAAGRGCVLVPARQRSPLSRS